MLEAIVRQNASAFVRDIGGMKLTDAPPSTQSMSTSLNPSISRSPMVCRYRIRMLPDTVYLLDAREGSLATTTTYRAVFSYGCETQWVRKPLLLSNILEHIVKPLC